MKKRGDIVVKYYREKKGLTQEELARIIGVSYKTMYNIEKRNSTDVKTAIKIAKALETTVETIFEEEKKE